MNLYVIYVIFRQLGGELKPLREANVREHSFRVSPPTTHHDPGPEKAGVSLTRVE